MKKTGQNLHDLGLGSKFLVTSSKAQSIKDKIDKLDFIKIKNSVKNTLKRIKRQATDCEKINANHTSDKGLISSTLNIQD